MCDQSEVASWSMKYISPHSPPPSNPPSAPTPPHPLDLHLPPTHTPSGPPSALTPSPPRPYLVHVLHQALRVIQLRYSLRGHSEYQVVGLKLGPGGRVVPERGGGKGRQLRATASLQPCYSLATTVLHARVGRGNN